MKEYFVFVTKLDGGVLTHPEIERFREAQEGTEFDGFSIDVSGSSMRMQKASCSMDLLDEDFSKVSWGDVVGFELRARDKKFVEAELLEIIEHVFPDQDCIISPIKSEGLEPADNISDEGPVFMAF